MIKLIIFDLDGVLVDAKEIHYNALNTALKNVDKKYVIKRDEHLSTYDGNPTRTKLKMLSQNKGLPYKLHDAIWKDKQQLTIQMINDLEKDKRLINVLERLEQDGYILCCATNSVRHSATIQLTRRGFIDHLEFVFTNQDVVNPKPNTEIYLRCMIKAGVSPKETIILEDSEIGRKGANETGAKVLEIEDSADVTYRKIRKFIENVK
jgi:HAD superfamily hydrolase (TIGR01509 family)